MLTRWTLENFKPIRERLDLPLAPLTVLAGLNSSGKSSFLQSILLIAQTLANQKQDEPLVLNGPLVRLGAFEDVRNDRAKEPRIGIGFTLGDGSRGSLFPIDVDARFAAAAHEGAAPGPQAVRAALLSTRITLPLDRDDVRVDVTSPGSGDEMHYELQINLERVEDEAAFQVAHFLPLLLLYRNRQIEAPLHGIVNRRVGRIIDTFSSAIRYLGPLRAEPQAIQGYSPSGQPDDVGPRGEYAAAVYASNRKHPIPWWNPVSRQVETATLEEAMNTWLRYLSVADHVGTREADMLGVAWMVRPTPTTRERSLQAVGVGVSQVLPILVSGLLAPEGTILIMEQPELHLHERPQARLGDFFYGLTRVGKQVFVETHSAVLINQLRYLIVKGDQEVRDAIAIYFVEQDDQGDARFQPIRIAKGGAVENWPDGFFDESFRQEDRITEEGIRARGKRANA
jgi:predicted ATPase